MWIMIIMQIRVSRMLNGLFKRGGGRKPSTQQSVSFTVGDVLLKLPELIPLNPLVTVTQCNPTRTPYAGLLVSVHANNLPSQPPWGIMVIKPFTLGGVLFTRRDVDEEEAKNMEMINEVFHSAWGIIEEAASGILIAASKTGEGYCRPVTSLTVTGGESGLYAINADDVRRLYQLMTGGTVVDSVKRIKGLSLEAYTLGSEGSVKVTVVLGMASALTWWREPLTNSEAFILAALPNSMGMGELSELLKVAGGGLILRVK